jgi:Protein of unknown function (DUF551)
MKESTICVPSDGTKAQTTTTVETQHPSANIATNAMLAAGWISVRDNLPKEQTHVMVWVGGLVNQPIKHFYTSTGKWMNMETIVLPKYYEVEFWMPLPVSPACS